MERHQTNQLKALVYILDQKTSDDELELLAKSMPKRLVKFFLNEKFVVTSSQTQSHS